MSTPYCTQGYSVRISGNNMLCYADKYTAISSACPISPTLYTYNATTTMCDLKPTICTISNCSYCPGDNVCGVCNKEGGFILKDNKCICGGGFVPVGSSCLPLSSPITCTSTQILNPFNIVSNLCISTGAYSINAASAKFNIIDSNNKFVTAQSPRFEVTYGITPNDKGGLFLANENNTLFQVFKIFPFNNGTTTTFYLYNVGMNQVVYYDPRYNNFGYPKDYLGFESPTAHPSRYNQFYISVNSTSTVTFQLKLGDHTNPIGGGVNPYLSSQIATTSITYPNFDMFINTTATNWKIQTVPE